MNDMQNRGGVAFTEYGVELNGRYEVLLCGSLFYFRLPRSVWKDRIAKLKRAGYNCADVYFPWNYHERADGSFDFTGERDVRYFLEEMKRAGMYVIARPGPYICSEWNGGGIPARILESGKPIRCADKAFLAETEKWYRAVLGEIAPYTFSHGGPVILLQIENELDFFDCPDPEEYTAKLAKIARKTISDVPFFCCAGQYDVKRAGGFANGLNATLNCYPDSLDPSFDRELHAYAKRFLNLGKPLLVSETNRDHFLLRRELACGAKLLGAYNQVAGVNFEYYQAVNNWGLPDAFLSTVYDFRSMIDVAGNYRAEAEEAVLFSAFLKTAGQALARALPCENTVVPDSCTFKTAEGGFCVLALSGGGYAVCVPNFSESGSAEFTFRGNTVKAEVPARRAPFLLFGFDLAPLGIPARITRTNCEPIHADAEQIVFICEAGEPMAGLDFGEGEELILKDGEIRGVKVKFVIRAKALALLTDGNPPVCGTYRSRELKGFCRAGLPCRRELPVGKKTSFGALGIGEGSAEYELELPVGKELWIERPCDMLRVRAEGVDGETYFADGRDRVIPASADGKYVVTAEKWGHSNFDDSQSPAIRLSCKKGVTSFGIVQEKIIVGRCDFRLLEEYGAEKIETAEEFPVRLSVHKWNSTRKPVVCAYSTPVCRRSERLIVKTTEKTDVAVYLDGTLLGECDYGSFELTNHIKTGETRTLTLVYRKRVWTEDCGEITLLYIDGVAPKRIRALTAAEMIPAAGTGEPLSLPLPIEKEEALRVPVATEAESIISFRGKNVKITCVADGRVVGRLLVGWEHAPALRGAEPNKLYWCPDWGGELYLYAEALGKDACLSGAEILSV